MTNNFIPNDPLLANQWHLINFGQVGEDNIGNDVNVLPAWRSQITGKDVVIGIVDDGLQYTHSDLQPNYRSDLSFDFTDNDNDPSPGAIDVEELLSPEIAEQIPPELQHYFAEIESYLNPHGTSVAGVAAASGDNGEGVSGVAFDAEIAGIRLGTEDLFSLFETNKEKLDEKIAKALSHENQEIDIYNNSWGSTVENGQLLDAPGALTQEALKNGVTNGREGLGNIYVWAAGNGLQYNDNVNYDGHANSRYTIAVSAIDATGKQADYSEPGAPILVTTYSGASTLTLDGEAGITTTDLQGNDGSAVGFSIIDTLLGGDSPDKAGNYPSSVSFRDLNYNKKNL